MTALQELKNYIKGNLDNLKSSVSDTNRNDVFQAIVLVSEDILQNIDTLLDKEKQQIIDAVDGYPIQNRDLDGEQYYEKTYGE